MPNRIHQVKVSYTPRSLSYTQVAGPPASTLANVYITIHHQQQQVPVRIHAVTSHIHHHSPSTAALAASYAK